MREYSDERELIKDFVNFRMTILDKRILREKEKSDESMRWLNVKAHFILSVLNDNIDLKGKTKAFIITQILDTTEATDDDCERLLRMNILSLTKEMMDELKAKVEVSTNNSIYWDGTTALDQFEKDIKTL